MSGTEDTPKRPGVLALLLSVVGAALAAALAVFPLAGGEIIGLSAVAAALGALLGPRFAARPVRTPVVLVGVFLGPLVCAGVAAMIAGSAVFGRALGAEATRTLADLVLFGGGAGSFFFCTRWLGERRRAFAIFEVALIFGAAAQLVFAHRNGMIHRPFSVADPVLAEGGDPTDAFIAIGVLACALVAAVLVRESSNTRLAFHGLSAVLILALLATFLGHTPLPQPEVEGIAERTEREADPDATRGRGRGPRGPTSTESGEDGEAPSPEERGDGPSGAGDEASAGGEGEGDESSDGEGEGDESSDGEGEGDGARPSGERDPSEAGEGEGHEVRPAGEGEGDEARPAGEGEGEGDEARPSGEGEGEGDAPSPTREGEGDESGTGEREGDESSIGEGEGDESETGEGGDEGEDAEAGEGTTPEAASEGEGDEGAGETEPDEAGEGTGRDEEASESGEPTPGDEMADGSGPREDEGDATGRAGEDGSEGADSSERDARPSESDATPRDADGSPSGEDPTEGGAPGDAAGGERDERSNEAPRDGTRRDGAGEGTPEEASEDSSSEPEEEPSESESDATPPPATMPSERDGTGGAGGPPPPIVIVTFHDDFTPPEGAYYFRQDALSQFNGRRFVHAPGRDPDVAEHFPTDPIALLPEQTKPVRREVETTVSLLVEHAQPIALVNPAGLMPATNPDPQRFLRSYRVRSFVRERPLVELLGHGLGDPSWDDETRAHYVSGSDDPRYAQLAAEITAIPEGAQGAADTDAGPTVRDALAIIAWLGSEGTYDHTRQYDGDGDAAARFLFGDRVGYCVHFANAAVHLLRAHGIPARVAEGYAAPAEFRRGGSALAITGQLAHAWPEVYVEGLGWVVMDVAPARSNTPPPRPVDAELQQLLGEMARGGEALEEAAAERGSFRFPWPTWTQVAWFVLFAFVAALLFAYARKIWRRIAPRIIPTDEVPRARYIASIDRLADAGYRRAPGESPEAFAARLADIVPSFGAITRAHLGAAFGGTVPPEIRDSLRRHRALGDELRDVVPLSRRLVGLLSPLTPFLHR